MVVLHIYVSLLESIHRVTQIELSQLSKDEPRVVLLWEATSGTWCLAFPRETPQDQHGNGHNDRTQDSWIMCFPGCETALVDDLDTKRTPASTQFLVVIFVRASGFVAIPIPSPPFSFHLASTINMSKQIHHLIGWREHLNRKPLFSPWNIGISYKQWGKLTVPRRTDCTVSRLHETDLCQSIPI